MIGIYSITNEVNGKRYIGQSKNIEQRFMGHKSALRNNHHANCHLQSAWNKYGEDAFSFDVIEECEYDDLNAREIYYINLYDTCETGYNLCQGGDGNPGYKHTEEEIIKMRRIQSPKMVVQLDLEGNYVKTWIGGVSHISKELGISRRNIESCCKQLPRHKTAYGYLWFYLEDYENDKIDWQYYLSEHGEHIVEPVYQLDFDGTIIKKWKNAKIAAKALNLSCKRIKACCNLNSSSKRCGEYLWMYEKNYSPDIDWENYYEYTDLNRKVCQFDKNRQLLSIYDSATEAAKILNRPSASGITACCRKRVRSAFGYIWVYKDDYDIDNIDWAFYEMPFKSYKPVVQTDENGTVIKRFNSLTEAANYFNTSISTISNHVKGKYKNTKVDYHLSYA